MTSQELCATLRWIESAQLALSRCEEAAHDPEAAGLAIVLRAAIHAKTEALRAHMRTARADAHEITPLPSSYARH